MGKKSERAVIEESVSQEVLTQALEQYKALAEAADQANAVFESRMAVVNAAGAHPVARISIDVMASFPTAHLLAPSLAELQHFVYEQMKENLEQQYKRGELYAILTSYAFEVKHALTEDGPVKGVEGQEDGNTEKPEWFGGEYGIGEEDDD